MSRKGRIAAYATVVVVLACVFALYAKPQIMVALSDMVWACFGT
jgi:hypothetical protein